MNQSLGLSLIEVLISLFILSLMLLGIDAMQLQTLNQSVSTYYFSVANQQVNNAMVNIIFAGQQENFSAWQEENKLVLPNGRGEINGQKITVYWGDEPKCAGTIIGKSGCVSVNFSKDLV